MRTVIDQHFELADVWGAEGRELCDRLGAARSLDERIDELQRAFVRRLERQAGEDRASQLVERALPLLSKPPQSASHIEQVAIDLGVSARHFRRAFSDVVGLSPKTYAQVIRFQRAFRLARRSTHRNWAQIAFDAGYYDQAHMIEAFRRFADTTPTSFFRSSNATSR